jgi:hypothetical protein
MGAILVLPLAFPHCLAPGTSVSGRIGEARSMEGSSAVLQLLDDHEKIMRFLPSLYPTDSFLVAVVALILHDLASRPITYLLEVG